MNPIEEKKQFFLNQGNVDQTLKDVMTGKLSNVNNQLTPAQQIQIYKAIAADKTGAGQFISSVFNPTDRNQQAGYNSFVDQFHRDPNQNEYAGLAQAAQAGPTNVNSWIASHDAYLKANPQDPNSPYNPSNSNYQASTSGSNDSIKKEFQSILGRDPTDAELQHFSGGLASGQMDTYALDAQLKQDPTYLSNQDTQFRNGLNDTLSQYDTTEFNREKSGVMSDYAARGMQPGNSPSLDYALTDLMGKIASNRSAYLAQLSASQYGGNKNLAIGNYQNSLNQLYDQNQGNRQNNQNQLNYYAQRGDQRADYNTQMNDYLNFMNKNRSRGANPLYGAAGGAIGAGIGAFAGGPTGAMAGWNIGQGAGNAFAYQNW